ncbi:SDR family oxidoreductase [Occallatibacter riparius]|uniref:NmrA family NAD(P)-binding protein n=1 Tax=Occallatibacter riparius TaxID=1002689 RepID=A0A9J7BSX8_9BACT|nr:NmrA family NAD(P)-binding protein [Occallatibacter riparius]UWZ85980.1 NmrA family NAD(P)-binding protein [Occallatibacter riparius]
MRVLMIGATGRFAGLLVPELIKRGVWIRALVRSREAERAARDRGVDETVLGDLEDARGLISAAVGADGVFHIGPAFHPRESAMGVTMVNAAKAAGVRKFVYSGVIHPSLSKLTNHAAKRPVEEALYESGMTFTILQPASFMQNIEIEWPRIVETGLYALPYSQRAKVAYVDYRDVAEAAALAFVTERLDNGAFELSAPGMYSRIQVAGMISEALGRRIEAARIDFDEWADGAGLPEGPQRRGMQRLYANYDQYGFHGGNGIALRSALGREPRGLRQYFRELASSALKAA